METEDTITSWHVEIRVHEDYRDTIMAMAHMGRIPYIDSIDDDDTDVVVTLIGLPGFAYAAHAVKKFLNANDDVPAENTIDDYQIIVGKSTERKPMPEGWSYSDGNN